MKDKIAEIIKIHHDFHGAYKDDELADKILSLFEFQVEVKCPAKCYHGIVYYGSNSEDWEQAPCERCEGGKKKFYRPATPEEMEIGGILREVKR